MKKNKSQKCVQVEPDELEGIIRDLKEEIKAVDDDWMRTLETSRMKEMGITFSIRESRIILHILEGFASNFENQRRD